MSLDFEGVCRSHGGVRTKTGFEFPTVAAAGAALGFAVPDCLSDRVCTVVRGFDRLTIQTRGDDECGWSLTARKGYLTLVVEVEPHPIDFVRVVDVECRTEGIYILTKRNEWCWVPESSAIRVLMAGLGIRRSDAEPIMGSLHIDPWHRTCEPFKPEYPGGKVWNRGAPQLAFEPHEGDHPHWNMIFDHVGHAITRYIPAELKAAGVVTGGDYLRAWVANIFRDPACRLPYLFLFGAENCGKSMLWESIAILVTSGVVKADRALTSEFNGELDGAILCAVEEKDISRASGVLERMKDAITGHVLAIRRLFANQYQVPNFTHWIQTSNSRGACLIPPGDTRFVAIPVRPLVHDIPKPDLFDRLREEAPALLFTLLNMTLPEPTGRLALPAIDTPDKLAIQAQHLPAMAHKIADLMATRDKWTGTARELREQLGEGPVTIAKLRASVDGFAAYLATQGIVAEFPEQRTAKGYIVELKKNESR